MKKIILLSFISFFFLPLFSQNDEKEIKLKSNVSSATIYLNSSEITRKKSVRLYNGRNKLIFTGLSPSIDDKSVRVTVEENVEILMISTSVNYLVDDEKKPEIKELKDSLQIIDIKLQENNDELDAYKIEKELLKSNQKIGGENTGVSIDELKETADYYRTRILDINKRMTKIKRESSKLSKKRNRIQNQLNVLNSNSSYARKEVTVLLETEKTMTSEVVLNYLVYNAGWSPVYDIRAIDTDKPIDLIYRAKVFNNTSIDWKNIDITLSTNDANLDNAKPKLTPWYLREAAQVSRVQSGTYNKKNAPPQMYQQRQDANLEDEIVGGNVLNLEENVVYDAAVPVLSYEFKIDKKYSIPADDKPYLVDISDKELSAVYKHYAVSKLDPAVFLIAKVVGWEELNLIDGPANIFYSGSYIGKSFIYTGTVKDTLDVSLGRDSKVIVNRKKINKYSSTQFIGNKKTTTFAYQFEVKNNHQSRVELQISDQIPISQSDDIEVKLIEDSGGELNNTTGEIKWKVNLAPAETKKIEFKFSVKYPKDISVPLIQNKTQQIRYFE